MESFAERRRMPVPGTAATEAGGSLTVELLPHLALGGLQLDLPLEVARHLSMVGERGMDGQLGLRGLQPKSNAALAWGKGQHTLSDQTVSQEHHRASAWRRLDHVESPLHSGQAEVHYQTFRTTTAIWDKGLKPHSKMKSPWIRHCEKKN